MSNELETMANSLKEVDSRELSSFIDETYTELVVNKVNNIIPEIVFKEYFLEFFYGMTKGDNESTLYLKWIELAGGVYNEVDVVDVNGNVIFSVPSIFSRPEVDSDIMTGKNFDKIINTYNLKKARFETEGTNYLLNELSGVNSGVVAGTELTKDGIRWYNIFNRYGLLNNEPTAQPQAVAKTIQASNEMDIYDYD